MILYTGGTFDLFHAGHANFLYHCKKIVGDSGKVIVALNTNDFVLRTKEVQIIPYEERKRVLEACKYVDQVICNETDEDSKPTILKVMPNFIAIGTDWAVRDYYTQMQFTQKWLDSLNITLLYIPYYTGISSTQIRDLLLGK